MRPNRRQLWILAGAVLLALLLATGVGLLHRPGDAPSAASGQTPRSGLPTVAVADLPPQARDTLALIDRGGPFPYRQDNTIFSNAERLLPVRATGYYREYTVPTPGSPDRGARRLIAGTAGDVYYTADHYATFRQVLR